MKLDSVFALIGLDQSHAAVYETLVRRGPLTVAELARGAKLHRPAAYRAIGRLEEEGLVARVLKGKRVHFAAQSPDKLDSRMEEARHASATLLLGLKDEFDKRKKAPEVTVGRGRSGIKNVYDDIIRTLPRGGVFYRYSSGKRPRARHAYVPERYEARRDAKRLERYVITNKRSSALKAQKLERYIKIIPAEFDRFEYDITLLVYKDKIAYVDYASETAITIRNAAIAEFQQKLFKLLFSKL